MPLTLPVTPGGFSRDPTGTVKFLPVEYGAGMLLPEPTPMCNLGIKKRGVK
jgi:hypothetical protein